MAAPQVKWTAPAPMWPTVSSNGQSIFRQPAILRFATDDFMDEFMNTIAVNPARLGQWKAEAETWRGPATSPIPVKTLPTFAQRVHRMRLNIEAASQGNAPVKTISDEEVIPAGDFKLYQPAHRRFYLITAGLVCTLPGLPDRLLDFNQDEKTSFVIRRLQPHQQGEKPTENLLSEFDEYAFVLSSSGNYWQYMGPVSNDPLSPTQILADGEERHSLFGVTYGENGRSRRILAGMIPVGKREEFVGAPIITTGETGASDLASILPDARSIDFQAAVIQPWNALIDLEGSVQRRFSTLEADLTAAAVEGDEYEAATNEKEEFLDQTHIQIQGSSWFILLDFADYLHKYLSDDFWTSLTTPATLNLSPGESTLLANLESLSANGQTLANALANIGDYRAKLENEEDAYDGTGDDWPDLFSLVDAGLLAPLKVGKDPLANLVTWVIDALADNETPANTPALPLATQQMDVDQSQPAWYIIRCVFERPQCTEQGAYIFSEPTEPFQIASFFDPDAPARPIRISMPLDTSPAGLRKFSKNTAFVLSDILACQLERTGNLTLGDLVLSVLPWPFHKALPEADADSCSKNPENRFGMICTLSIPIITICALILLMIIVAVLDSIFKWLPYIIMCFPLPSLEGKNPIEDTT